MFGKKGNDSSFQIEDAAIPWLPEQEVEAETFGHIPEVIHEELIRSRFFEKIDPAKALSIPVSELERKIVEAVTDIVSTEKLQLNMREQEAISQNLRNDMLGTGPIEILLSDETVTDILVNGPNIIFVERFGILQKTKLTFRDDEHLIGVARRIAMSAGRRVDEASPMVDARLKDGSRVNIIIPPLSVNGVIISIRKFPAHAIDLKELALRNALSRKMCLFLEKCALARLNILISGGTGAGKTTLLNAICQNIRDEERVVTIEDAAEINIGKQHVISLETRQKNVEGKGEVSQRDLLRNALRMRPDRIIIGEVRGPEAHEMLQAMNTGHDGSMSTIHANSTRDALVRLEDLVLTYHSTIQPPSVRRQIVSSVDLIIHVDRDHNGHRHIRTISEVINLEGDVVVTQDLFKYEQTMETEKPQKDQQFKMAAVRPKFINKIRENKLKKEIGEMFS